jgi:hypothetical protein
MIGHFLHLCDPAAAAAEPSNTHQIANADPETVEKSVIRDTCQPRPIFYVDESYIEAIAFDQGRHEAMQSIEIGQGKIDIAPNRLEPATGIARAIL